MQLYSIFRAAFLGCTWFLSLVALHACSGGTSTLNMADTGQATRLFDPPDEPPPEVIFGGGATHSPLGFPYYDLADLGFPYLVIGGETPPWKSHDIEAIGRVGDIGIAWGHADNGIGRFALLRELREDIRELGHVTRWNTPPVVRVAHGTSDELLAHAHFAVSMINTALPADWQLGFDFRPAARGADVFSPGAIMITFAPLDQWPDAFDAPEGSLGGASTAPDASGVMTDGAIWIDAGAAAADGILQLAIGHELLHTLGRDHPVNLYGRFDTIMAYNYAELPYMLFQLDREMLLAVYGRLEAGTTRHGLASDLGPWSETSTNLLGVLATPLHPHSTHGEDIDIVSFAVQMQNGHATPRVSGPEPLTWIWNNPQLTGSASWSGALVGFTPAEKPVFGFTDMTLDLASLDGTVDFTGLEQWPKGQAPGGPDTGLVWGDGDLHYTVQVNPEYGDAFGNYDPGDDDDYGVLDGGFFGPDHEAVAGVLGRDDLTAAFGAER